MNKNWLFLRGAWDNRSQEQIDNDHDMWLQLFDAIATIGGSGRIWFHDSSTGIRNIKYKNCKVNISNGLTLCDKPRAFDYVFCRGGFDYYDDILLSAKCKHAYKIYYGAGRRFMPQNLAVKYDLVYVDSQEQKEYCERTYNNVKLFKKPVANCFVKKFDVCYIAKEECSIIKNTKKVYETLPNDISMLHLGKSVQSNMDNVVCRYPKRHCMPQFIDDCYVGIVPYMAGVDSAPRAALEMAARGLPLVVSRNIPLNISTKVLRYNTMGEMWGCVRALLKQYRPFSVGYCANKILEDIATP